MFEYYISTDKDPGLRIESFAIIKLRGVTTKYKILIKIVNRNRLFSPLRIEAKLIENLLPLELEEDALDFNKRPEYA